VPRSGLARAGGSGSSRRSRFDGGCATGRSLQITRTCIHGARHGADSDGMTIGLETRRGAPRPVRSQGGHRIGAMLDQLRRHAFHVLQEVELTGAGTVEFLVMGPTGVFTIATCRRFDGALVAAVKRQATTLQEVLDVAVTPVICPPGRQGRPPFEHADVWVVRRDDLVSWLRAQQNEVLEFVRFPRLADRL
jgi:hypothetical protein